MIQCSGDPVFWRLDALAHAASCASGEGAFRVGGRWNSPGIGAIYASLNPATAAMEVAVHKGFKVLDTQPHILTSARVADPALVHIVMPGDVPNPNWLNPCAANSNQQRFDDDLLAQFRYVLIPSTVSKFSWNLIFDATKPASDYDLVAQRPFALAPRVQP